MANVPDDEHEQQHPTATRRVARCSAGPRGSGPSPARPAPTRWSSLGSHHQQRDDDEHERHRVHAKHDAGADRRRSTRRRARARRSAAAGRSALFRPIAFGRSAGGTSSGTNDCRVGLSTANANAEQEDEDVDHPELDDAGDVEHREQHRDHRHRDLRARAAPCACRSGRRSTPPHTPNSSVGRNCSAIASPTAKPLLCDRSSTSHSMAIVCIHVPHCETSWPEKNSRKLRMCNERKVFERSCEPSRLVVLSCSSSGSAASSSARSSSVRRATRCARNASLRVRLCARSSRPASVIAARATRRSVAIDDARRVAPLLEAGDDAGHARRLHLLHRRELAQRDRARAARWSPARPASTR